jgi:hypothetical protein
LKRGQDEIRSNYISYNSSTEEFKAEGRAATTTVPGTATPADDGRVRGVFQPRSDSPLPGQPKAADPAAKPADAEAKAAAPAPAKSGVKRPKSPPPAPPLKPADEIAPARR